MELKIFESLFRFALLVEISQKNDKTINKPEWT